MGYAHVLAVPTGAREPDLVVVQAQLRLAFLAAAAAVAWDDPFADDAVTDGEVADVLTELGHGAAPLVPRDEREADPARVGESTVEHLEVRSADPGDVAPDDYFAHAHGRSLDVDIRDFVRPLDHDGLHRSTVSLPGGSRPRDAR
jgi:hypothetical protein